MKKRKNKLLKKNSLKKIHTSKKILILIALLLFFSGIIFSLIKYQSLEIKKIECTIQNQKCRSDQITLPENILGKNFLKYDPLPLQKKLLFTYPEFKEVEIKKKFPNRLQIQIKLRKPIAIIEDKNKNRFFIDENAAVFKKASLEKNNFIVIKTQESVQISQLIVSPNITFCLKLVKILEASLLPVKEIDIKNFDNLIVLLQNKKIIFFTRQKNAEKQVDALQFILNNKEIEEDKKNVIDLRFENPIIK